MNGYSQKNSEWDVLDEQTVRASLGSLANAMQITVFQTCDSTNTEAKRRILDGLDAVALLLAEEQTAGRGRLGRSFHSPRGAGLYLSLAFPLRDALPDAVSLTCAASVAVMRAIRSTIGIQTEIKWVNDLLLNGKKVCGILTEAVTVGETTHIIIGVGINLRPIAFPPELAEVACSLENEDLPKSRLAAAVTTELMQTVKHLKSREWLTDYRTHSCVIGKPIQWIENGQERRGFAEGIDETGALSVRAEDGTTVLLQTGEISVRTITM